MLSLFGLHRTRKSAALLSFLILVNMRHEIIISAFIDYEMAERNGIINNSLKIF